MPFPIGWLFAGAGNLEPSDKLYEGHLRKVDKVLDTLTNRRLSLYLQQLMRSWFQSLFRITATRACTLVFHQLFEYRQGTSIAYS